MWVVTQQLVIISSIIHTNFWKENIIKSHQFLWMGFPSKIVYLVVIKIGKWEVNLKHSVDVDMKTLLQRKLCKIPQSCPRMRAWCLCIFWVQFEFYYAHNPLGANITFLNKTIAEGPVQTLIQLHFVLAGQELKKCSNYRRQLPAK